MLTNPNWQGYCYGAWASLAASVLVGIWEAGQGQWQNILIMLGFGAAALLFLKMTDRIPSLISFVVAVAALINGIGYVFNLYTQLAWFDIIVHGYTLFALTLPLGFLAFYNVLESLDKNRLQLILAIASFGIALGAWWEVAEWGFDMIVSGNAIKGKDDTMIDLIVDSVGAFGAALLSVVIWHNQSRTSRRTPN